MTAYGQIAHVCLREPAYAYGVFVVYGKSVITMAKLELTIMPDYSSAYMVAEPSYSGAPPPTREEIIDILELNGIRHPPIEKAVESLVGGLMYNQNVTVVSKTPPVDGVYGTITYRFAQTSALAPTHVEGKGDIVDHKDLGLIHNIVEGTVIADIKHATEGTPGMDIRGMPIPCTPGKEAKFTVGKGTKLSEDESQIVAAVSGNLRWDKGCFTVDEVVTINGDIGTATGNIDFIGDIVIKGLVNDNFVVKSKKSVKIAGIVAGAVIEAGGDIELKTGCTSATITCGGNFKSGFCEGGSIRVEKDLTSNALVSSNVYCGGNIVVTSGKGAIIGGKVTCLNSITVKNLGSDSYTKTSVVLGNDAILCEQKLVLENEIVKHEENVKQLMKVEKLLGEMRKKAPLPKDKEEVYINATKNKYGFLGKIKKIKVQIALIDEQLKLVQNLCVDVKGTVHPGVKLNIGQEILVIEQESVRCRIRMNEQTRLIELAPLM